MAKISVDGNVIFVDDDKLDVHLAYLEKTGRKVEMLKEVVNQPEPTPEPEPEPEIIEEDKAVINIKEKRLANLEKARKAKKAKKKEG